MCLLKMKMNNRILARNFLNFGNFSVLNSQLTAKKRSLLNRLIKLVLFLNAAKLIVISLGFWLAGLPSLRMYLIEFLLFEETYQRAFDVCICILHVGVYRCFCYWSSLNSNPRALESFRFLFISDLQKSVKDLQQVYWRRYRLNRELTEKFLAAYRLFCFLSLPAIVAYGMFVFFIISRCLYHSFFTVCLTYFLSLGLFFFTLTLSSYLLLDFFAVPRFILVFLSTEFLILRASAIDQLINRLIKPQNASERRSKSEKQKKRVFEALHLMNDFFRQFKQMNTVLDLSFARILLGFYSVLFFIPYFLFFAENQLAMKILLSVTVITIFSLCFSISIYNDRLKRQASFFFDFGFNFGFEFIKFYTLSFHRLDHPSGEHRLLCSVVHQRHCSQNFAKQRPLNEQPSSEHIAHVLWNRILLPVHPRGVTSTITLSS